jgi:putative addiction module killer protein
VVIDLREYLDKEGSSSFGDWFERLNSPASEKVAVALYRLASGNFSNVKSVGTGVLEYRIDFGPGYRIYFGRDGERLVILLGGGSKQRQDRDVRQAIDRWSDYKKRKKVK